LTCFSLEDPNGAQVEVQHLKGPEDELRLLGRI
jgi:hypothetical protein